MMKKVRKNLLILAGTLLTVGFGYAVFLPEAGVEQDKARVAFQKGLNLNYNYKYSASIDYFLQALAYEPEFHLARRMLGQSLYYSGQIDEALNEWKILFEQNYYDPSLQLHMQSLRSFHSAPDLSFNYFKTLRGKRGYQFSFPTYITSLQNNNLVLLSQGDGDNGNILIITPNGVFTENLRRVSGKVELPVAAAYDGKILWITDMKGDRIHRLEVENRVLGPPVYTGLDSVGEPGSGPLQFHGPAGICFNGENYFVADQGNNRIQKISAKGEYVQDLLKVNDDRPLYHPFGVACDTESVFISEPESGSVLEFDVFGNFVRYIGEGMITRPRHLSLSRNYLLIADELHGVVMADRSNKNHIIIDRFENQENQPGEFYRPYSAIIDSFGNMFVADYGAHELVQFVPEQFMYSNLEVWVERVYADDYPNIGVWVSVKDQLGNYLVNLDSDNFSLIENDANIGRIGTAYLKKFSNQSSWVVVVSRSESMKQYSENLPWLSDFFVSGLREKDRVKVISYNNDIRPDSDWTNSRLKVHKALQVSSESDYKGDGVEGLGKTLYEGIGDLLPEKGSRALVWITDGLIYPENMDNFTIARIENYARNNHIPIYIISFENPDHVNWKMKGKLLRDLADRTGGRYYNAYDSSLGQLKEALRGSGEQRYVLTYQSNGDSKWKGQYMDIRVQVDFQGRIGMERAGYFIK